MAKRPRSGRAPAIVNSPVEEIPDRGRGRAADGGRPKSSRYGHRDATMILLAFRHGLRAAELCDLQWHQVDLNAGRLHVHRVKSGTPSVHPLQGDELRALRRQQRESLSKSFVFTTERGGPMTPKGFNTLIRPDRRASADAVQGPSAHATPWLRLRAGERRS